MSNKILPIILLGLLIPTMVMAANQSFDVDFKDRESTVNGIHEVGRIRISENSHIFEEYEDFTIKTGDGIKWKGGERLYIYKKGEYEEEKNISIDNGENLDGDDDLYPFGEEGEYLLIDEYYDELNTSLDNYSKKIWLTVVDGNTYVDITDSTEQQGISINHIDYDDENHSLPHDFRADGTNDFDLFLNVLPELDPGDYEFSLDVNGITHDFPITVEENVDWEIINKSFSDNQTIKAGETRHIGNVIFNNTGNVETKIEMSKKGNGSEMLGIPNSQTLFKQSTLSMELQLMVPTVQKPGTYDLQVVVTDLNDSKSETKNLTVNVVDSIKPKIESINFSTDKAFMDNEVRVVASDNDGVANVTMSYGNVTEYFDKDENLFSLTHRFNRLSEYELEFCAIDYNDNEVCKDFNRTFIKKDIVDFNDEFGQKTLRLPAKKYGKFSDIWLYNITEDVPEGITVELVTVEPSEGDTDEDDYLVRLMDEDGSISSFEKYDNELVIEDKGLYSLQMKSDVPDDYEGVIRLHLPDYIEEKDDITFRVSFKEYDVPEDFSREWLYRDEIENNRLECEVYNEEDLDEAYRLCEFKAPVDLRAEDLAVPITLSEKNELENKTSMKAEELKKSKNRNGIVISGLTAIIIVMILTMLFYARVYPNLRIMKKLEDDE